MLGARKSVVSRVLRCSRGAVRGFSKSTAAWEVQRFDMPSMSPTMEEGGIVEWKVKEGDAFQAGDVLLEIETDKAEIAVEAGDDGVLAKILVQAGEKGIAVGNPIAVTAEAGDDLSSIDYDALLASPKAEAASSEQSVKSEPSSTKAPSNTEEAASSTEASQVSEPTGDSKSITSQQIHGSHGLAPLPAAQRLMHEHNLSVDDIKGSGPFGRITKGDILAHIGKIPKDYPVKEQARFSKLQKMDLSNVEVAPRKPSSTEADEAKPEKPKPLVTTVSIPLNADLVGKVASAQRNALKQALLSLKPKPSVLRDPTLDALTAPTKPPFVVKSAKVQVLRAKPVSLDVVIEEPPAKTSSKAAEVFIKTLQSELSI